MRLRRKTPVAIITRVGFQEVTSLFSSHYSDSPPASVVLVLSCKDDMLFLIQSVYILRQLSFLRNSEFSNEEICFFFSKNATF
jgi:hypothetical protein